MSVKSHFARLLLVLLLCLAVTACGKNKLTQENFDKLKEGSTTLEEAQKLLGKGEKEGGDGSNIAAGVGIAVGGVASAPTSGGGEVYVFERGDRKIRLTFRQGKLVHKQKEGF